MMALCGRLARSSCIALVAPVEFPTSFLDDPDCSFAGLHASS
jgi:hypothetical protein